MPLRNYLAAIALYSNCAKGMSALQLSRDLDVQYKTAFVLAHKMCESLVDFHADKLTGEVEIDGAYVNKHVRPHNNIENRIDRRLKENQYPKKRAVIVMRERGEAGEGATKTRTFLTKSENRKSAFLIMLVILASLVWIWALLEHRHRLLSKRVWRYRNRVVEIESELVNTAIGSRAEEFVGHLSDLVSDEKRMRSVHAAVSKNAASVSSGQQINFEKNYFKAARIVRSPKQGI